MNDRMFRLVIALAALAAGVSAITVVCISHAHGVFLNEIQQTGMSSVGRMVFLHWFSRLMLVLGLSLICGPFVVFVCNRLVEATAPKSRVVSLCLIVAGWSGVLAIAVVVAITLINGYPNVFTSVLEAKATYASQRYLGQELARIKRIRLVKTESRPLSRRNVFCLQGKLYPRSFATLNETTEIAKELDLQPGENIVEVASYTEWSVWMPLFFTPEEEMEVSTPKKAIEGLIIHTFRGNGEQCINEFQAIDLTTGSILRSVCVDGGRPPRDYKEAENHHYGMGVSYEEIRASIDTLLVPRSP